MSRCSCTGCSPPGSALDLDLREVTYLGSTALEVIFSCAVEHRINLVTGSNPIVASVIEISGLAQVVTIRNSN
jgi:anti-anti-sigma regulatory factor